MPIKTHTSGPFAGETEQGEDSYAVIGFSRRSHGGGGAYLFGSELRHQHTIGLTIQTATVRRGLSQYWYHGGKQIIEVEMSEMQFAQLITSLNMGDGIPCTLLHTQQKGRIRHEPGETLQDVAKRELQADLNGIAKALDEAESYVAGAKITEKERREILSRIGRAKHRITSHLPFLMEQYKESMSKVVTDAKAAIEGFVMHGIQKMGIKSLRDFSQATQAEIPYQAPQLIESGVQGVQGVQGDNVG